MAILVHGLSDTVRGWIELTAEPPASTAALRYSLDGRPIGPPIEEPPYRLRWCSRSVTNGPHTLVATAFGPEGLVIEQKRNPVRIDNPDGTVDARITVLSPDPEQTVRGILHWKVELDRTILDAEVRRLVAEEADLRKFDHVQFAIDGEVVAVQPVVGLYSAAERGQPGWTTCVVDTTQYRDGTHELLVTADAFRPIEGGGYKPLPALMWCRQVRFENGRARMEIRPSVGDLLLTPPPTPDAGPRPDRTWERVVSPIEWSCDGSSRAFSPAPGTLRWFSEHPNVAVVDATDPRRVLVRGVGVGVTRILMQYEVDPVENGELVDPTLLPRAVRVYPLRVRVAPTLGVQHFSRDGRVLGQFDPGPKGSFFVRAVYNLDDTEVALLADASPHPMVDASVNALTRGIYLRVRDNDFPAWQSSFDDQLGRAAAIAEQHRMSILFHGDDLARPTVDELGNYDFGALHETLNHREAPRAIRHAFTSAKDTNLAIAVEMFDEVDATFGSYPFLFDTVPNPTPQSSWLRGRWSRRPTVHLQGIAYRRHAEHTEPYDAFLRLVTEILPARHLRPSITWNVLGNRTNGWEAAISWRAPEYSDHLTHYWNVGRSVYPNKQPSSYQLVTTMDEVVHHQWLLQPRDVPQLMLVSLSGASYTKVAPGGEFDWAEEDVLGGLGVRPRDVTVMTMYAVAAGMAGVRAYNYDGNPDAGTGNVAARARADKVTVETGAGPFVTGADRWHAFAAVSRLIELLEPLVLHDVEAPLDLGPDLLTAARKGPDGFLWMAVNPTESAVRLPAHPLPDRRITTHRVVGGTRSTSVGRAEGGPLLPGEAIVWTTVEGQGVRFLQPMPDLRIAVRSRRLVVTVSSAVTRVDFYANGVLIGPGVRDPDHPDRFSCEWTPEPPRGSDGHPPRDRWIALRAIARGANSWGEAQTLVLVEGTTTPPVTNVTLVAGPSFADVFTVDLDGLLTRSRITPTMRWPQPAPGWARPALLSDPTAVPVAIRGPSGRVEVFVRNQGLFQHSWETGDLLHPYDLATGSRFEAWDAFTRLAGPAPLVIGDPTVAAHTDGRLEVFAAAAGPPRRLLHAWAHLVDGIWSALFDHGSLEVLPVASACHRIHAGADGQTDQIVVVSVADGVTERVPGRPPTGPVVFSAQRDGATSPWRPFEKVGLTQLLTAGAPLAVGTWGGRPIFVLAVGLDGRVMQCHDENYGVTLQFGAWTPLPAAFEAVDPGCRMAVATTPSQMRVLARTVGGRAILTTRGVDGAFGAWEDLGVDIEAGTTPSLVATEDRFLVGLVRASTRALVLRWMT